MSTKFQDIIKKVKQKKELSGVDDALISKIMEKHLNIIDRLNESETKILIKEIRNELRQYAGRFQGEWKDRESLLEKGDINSILGTHASTRERMDFYPELKNLIEELKIKSIIDLGCGINPLALSKPGIKYYAFDINRKELELVKGFFKMNNIQGEASFCDLRNIDACKFPESDLCIILKVFDVIEKRGHKLAEKIINKINSRYFLVSFSTKTLSGKPMNHPQRGWIERLLQRLNFSFRIIKSRNEIFYLAAKLGQ
jgi:2-polyprenyl-3-methyl-5-hydroxy-6-metoxy-1,4-benzoquinol methylase